MILRYLFVRRLGARWDLTVRFALRAGTPRRCSLTGCNPRPNQGNEIDPANCSSYCLPSGGNIARKGDNLRPLTTRVDIPEEPDQAAPEVDARGKLYF